MVEEEQAREELGQGLNIMARVDASKVIAMLKLKLKKAEADDKAKVAVGFTAAYALYVHEMIGPTYVTKQLRRKNKQGHIPWQVGGPKFLEGPFRRLQKELVTIISKAYKAGATLRDALMLAGLRLQRESQLACPVDTGNLKNSAFTRIVS